MMIDNLDGDDAWGKYWVTGALAAMHDWTGSDPVARGVAAFWREAGRKLAGRVVMDVGCGNAAIAHMVGHQSAAAVRRWLLVDAAPIAPAAFPLALAGRAEVYAPLDFSVCAPELAECCDALVSNFGLEYARWPEAARACAQALRDGGELLALMHGSESEVHMSALSELDELVFMLDTLEFPRHAQALLSAAGTAPADAFDRMMHGVEERDAYNRMVESAKDYLSVTGKGRKSRLAVALDLCGQAIRARSAGAGAHETLLFERFVAELQLERLRLTQMCASARDGDAMEAVASALADVGFELHPGAVLTVEGGTAGWILSAKRRRK